MAAERLIGSGVARTWRSLWRTPVFSATVVLTLTLGLGSAAAIFAVIDAVLIRPLPYGHADRLVGAWLDMPVLSMTHVNQSPGTYRTFQRFASSVEGIGIYLPAPVNLSDPGQSGNPQRVEAVAATASMIPLLQVRPVLGRTFTDSEDLPNVPLVAVLSEGLWRSRYAADPNILGRTVLAYGRPMKVIGVMPARFRFPNADVAMWYPLQLDPSNRSAGGFAYGAVARLAPGVTIGAAQRDFAHVLPRIVDVAPDASGGMTTQRILDQTKPVPRIVPLRDDVVGDISRTIWMVGATALLVLAVMCANVANLLLVRADGRHRELAVRAALGAGERRIVLGFFGESALLTTIAAILGLGVAWIGIHLLVGAAPSQIPRLDEIGVNLTVVAMTAAIAAIVMIVCSAAPAIRFAHAELSAALREGGRSGTTGVHRHRVRGALVATQIAFALVVLSLSALLLRSFQRLRAIHPGFDATGVATLWLALPSARYPGDSSVVRFYARLALEAARLPGVTSAALSSELPLTSHGNAKNPIYAEGDAAAAARIPQLALYTTIDAGYFRTMRIPLVAGRSFDPIDVQRGSEAVISIDAAQFYFHDSTGRGVIGKRFKELDGAGWYTVIGVAGGVRDTSLTDSPARTVYVPESLGGDTTIGRVSRTMALIVRTRGDVGQTTLAMQRLVHELDPTLPTFRARPLRALVDASMARVTFVMLALGAAACVTLVLAVVGLYGVIAYIVTMRTREVGVRIALGARSADVAWLVTRQAFVFAGAGLVAGLAIVAATTRFARSFLYETASLDPASIGAAIALLIVFAAAAAWIPARRASRTDPMQALRTG